MSLKAYDGMMTRKGFHYLQEKIKEYLPEFRKASEEQVFKAYAKLIYEHADGYFDVVSSINFTVCNSKEDKSKIEEIKVDEKTTLISFLYQSAKILSRSYFVNDFCVHLYLTLESKHPKKILVYPNILVEKHKKILLNFLNDWYAQNQCDADEKVSSKQWKERCDDWWGFNETRGLKSQIVLFDPQSYTDNLVDRLRGEDLINGILTFIPSDEKRINKIHSRAFINLLTQRYKDEDTSGETDTFRFFWNAESYLRTDEGQKEFEEYKKNNPISLTKIDAEYLDSKIDGTFKIR